MMLVRLCVWSLFMCFTAPWSEVGVRSECEWSLYGTAIVAERSVALHSVE